MERFTLCDENINEIHQIAKVKREINTENYLIPADHDTLFWCFYFITNSDTFDSIETKHTLAHEKQLKIQYAEEMQKFRDCTGRPVYHMTTTVAQLVNDRQINLQTFMDLCLMKDINVVYIKRQVCVNCWFSKDGGPVYIVKAFPNGTHGFKEDLENAHENILNKDYLEIDNPAKPVKAVSAYTIQNLLVMCAKLKIDTVDKATNKQKRKPDLYAAIVEAIPPLI